VLAFLERPAESSIALGVIVVGIPVYFVLKKRIARTGTIA